MSEPTTGRSVRASLTHSIAAAAGLIAVVTVLARATGFLRTLAFSGSVGATPIGEVYQSVNTVPNVVYEVAAGGVLAAVAVPLIAGRLGLDRAEEADRIASALLTWSVTVLLPLSVVVAVAAEPISRALLGGGDPDAVRVGRDLLVLFAPQVVLYGIGIVLTGILQSHRRFLAAALAPLLSSLVVIGVYLTYGAMTAPDTPVGDTPVSAVAVLGLGTTAGVLVLSLPLAVPVVRAGVRLRPTWSFPDGVARRVGSLAGAGAVALIGQQLAVIVTIWLANRAGDPGTLNVYQYTQAVYLLPYAVLAVPIATSALPALAHGHTAGADIVPVLARSSRGILLLTGGAMAVLISVARPVGSFFEALDRGADGAGGPALAAMPQAMFAYAPGVVGFGLAALLTRALYVRGRPLHAAAAVATGWVVAALVPLLLVPPGVGAATTLRTLGVWSSVGMTLTAVVLVVLVRRTWGAEALAGSGRTLGALLVAAAVAVAVGDVTAYYLGGTGLIGSLASGLTVSLVVVLVYLLGMSVGDRELVATARERGRRARERGRRARGRGRGPRGRSR